MPGRTCCRTPQGIGFAQSPGSTSRVLASPGTVAGRAPTPPGICRTGATHHDALSTGPRLQASKGCAQRDNRPGKRAGRRVAQAPPSDFRIDRIPVSVRSLQAGFARTEPGTLNGPPPVERSMPTYDRQAAHRPAAFGARIRMGHISHATVLQYTFYNDFESYTNAP